MDLFSWYPGDILRLEGYKKSKMSTYLIVDLLAWSMPLVLSFDKKVNFWSKWKYLFPSMLLTMLIFIPWDIFFTGMGIWGFNPYHIMNIYLFKLPLEEWLFFIVVPYCSVFTYEVLNTYIKTDYLNKYSNYISTFIVSILIILSFFNFARTYTFVCFILASFFIVLFQFLIRVNFMGRFYRSYLVILVPFLLVNGILTGSFIEGEVVWYNNSENLGVRLFTIPVEDIIYGFLLILLNIYFFEFFRKRSMTQTSRILEG
jgi:lycopene cyclase domain-containing protein